MEDAWARNFYGEKKRAKQKLIKELHELELLQDNRELSDEEYIHWASLKSQLDSVYLEEEIYWKNRSKQQWLEAGDHNTKFFHVIASHRNKKNRINYLDIQGQNTTHVADMKKHVIEYYKQLLGVQGTKFAHLYDTFWDETDKVVEIDRLSIEQPILVQELKEAVFNSSA